MRKITVLFAILLLLSSCSPSSDSVEASAPPQVSVSQSSNAESSSSGKEAEPDEASEAATKRAAAEKALDEKLAAEKKVAAEKAAAEKAAAEKEAAENEAAENEAAEKAAAEKAAAEKAAAEKAAAEKAAAEKVASEKVASEKVASKKVAAEKTTPSTRSASGNISSESSSKQNTSLNVSSVNFLSKVETAVLNAQNKERAHLGLQPLELNADLQAAARIRSREMYKNNYFAHTRPDGQTWSTVITQDVPITFVSAGENLCTSEYDSGYTDNANNADFWVQQWIDSPTHYENMIKPEFNQAGVGIYCITKDGITVAYATTLYAWVE